VKTQNEIRLKVLLWALVAGYTFMLPDAIIVYRNIVVFFGQNAAGKVPLLMVIAAAITYGIAILMMHRNWKNLLYLIPCALIASLIMTQVSNPNKHIHIPEYVLMTWLLYAILSKDYKGKGLFILIFIYASMLGVVDEIEQGINPARFYGLSDMMVNWASALIGIFTLMGLKKISIGDWAWTKCLKEFKRLLWLGLFGITGAVITCATLFQVQAKGDFWSVYPTWLFTWNILFLILAPLMLFLQRGAKRRIIPVIEGETAESLPMEAATAGLWVYPFLVILFYINALIVYIPVTGVVFN
jgi:hypothetical protein